MTLRLGDTLIAGSGANQDLSNLTSQGQNIANWSSNVTNCITEIPQDIKLELNNGTLTLKAGSKVYVPNGAGVFDVVTTSADRSLTNTSNDTYMVFVKQGGSGIELARLANQTGSGTTTPTSSWWVYYNTSDNKVYRIENGVNVRQESLPIAIITVSGGAISSINQVFNGFGYIGSTVFALPGVKGLIPNGRNADGTLKNIEFNIEGVETFTNPDNFSSDQVITYNNINGLHRDNAFYSQDSKPNFIEHSNQIWYNPITNRTFYYRDSSDNYFINSCLIGAFSNDSSSKITSFTPKTAFHALDYNDSSTISGWGMPSGRYIDLTLGASGSQYAAPANGWFCIRKLSTASGQEIRMFANNITYTANSGINGNHLEISIPCIKEKFLTIYYNAGGVTEQFIFIYAEGENV